ncbi:MAG: hypothetical protein K2I81_00280, partial [Alphaproteobacteria bacterium]|nr:hypothetical protein [Alphaproteobacteria bacterium]
MSKIIRVFACLFTLFFVGSAYAAGYTCDNLKKYTSCTSRYYLSDCGASSNWNGQTISSPAVGNSCILGTDASYTYSGGAVCPKRSTVKCVAGKYLPANKSSESDCTICPNGSYCVGGDFTPNYPSNQGIATCPAASTTTAAATSSYPDAFYPYTSTSGSVDKTTTPTRTGVYNQSWGTGWATINDCKAAYVFSNAGGSFNSDNVRYNSSTGKYDNFSGADIYYGSAKAGYYLYTKYSDTYCNTSTNKMLYRKTVVCPAGYYCPGGSVPQCSTGTHNNEWGRTICPAGKYCPAGASAGTNCSAGTYRSATGGTAASSCTACAIGSYSSAGATGCTACTGGKTTTATGQSSCAATCTNATGANTWTTPTWSANTVTNKCAISTCSTGYTKGGTASSTATSSYTCSANCNTVTLNATTNGGTANTTVYKRTGSTTWYSNNTCSTSITSITKPTKSNATYAGHYNTSSNSGGTQCVTSAGALSTSTSCNVTGATTFYARYNCNTGYTASGTTIAGACAASCIAVTLNNTQNGGTGGTTTLYKRVGSTTIYSDSACSTALTLVKPTKTNATYAGHYNTTALSGGTQCVTSSGTWSSGFNPTSATTCYARYNCNTGWTASGTTIAGTCGATCNAITFNATQNGGSGTATTLYKKSGSTTWYSNNTCSTTITALSSRPTKTNATYAGHYNTTAASGGTQCVTAAGALSTSTSCNVTGATTFYPQFTCNTGWTNAGTRIAGTCTATTNTITLNKNGGTGTCGGQSSTTNGS